MKNNNLKTLIKKYKITIFLALIGATLFCFVSLLFAKRYQSKVQLLVIQKQNNWRIDDAYSAAKSAEGISSILVHVSETTSFMDRVMGSGYVLDESLLDYNLEDRKEIWEKMVDARAVKNSGIIKLRVFHKDRDYAEQFAGAIAYVFSNKSSQYHGGGDRVEVKVIDGPITSFQPITPVTMVNVFLGFVLGLIAGLIFDRRKILIEKSDRFNLAGGGLEFGFSENPIMQNQNSSIISSENNMEPPERLPF